MNAVSEARTWVEQIDGPAALLRPSPWRFTPNAALDALLGPHEQQQPAWQRAFTASEGGLPGLLARGQAFQGRLSLDAAPGSN